jgi:hypothetical protein
MNDIRESILAGAGTGSAFGAACSFAHTLSSTPATQVQNLAWRTQLFTKGKSVGFKGAVGGAFYAAGYTLANANTACFENKDYSERALHEATLSIPGIGALGGSILGTPISAMKIRSDMIAKRCDTIRTTAAQHFRRLPVTIEKTEDFHETLRERGYTIKPALFCRPPKIEEMVSRHQRLTAETLEEAGYTIRSLWTPSRLKQLTQAALRHSFVGAMLATLISMPIELSE